MTVRARIVRAGGRTSSPWRRSAAARSAWRTCGSIPRRWSGRRRWRPGTRNPQLAENLRRAAELTRLPDDEVLAIYDALRPGRSTPEQLTAMAGELAGRGLPRCAALLTEAAEVYARRGLSA